MSNVEALEDSDRLTWAKVQEVKSELRHLFMLYNEDHHPNHVVCHCPQFFMRGILTTWDDPSTLESLQGSPARRQQKMLKRIPSANMKRWEQMLEITDVAFYPAFSVSVYVWMRQR